MTWAPHFAPVSSPGGSSLAASSSVTSLFLSRLGPPQDTDGSLRGEHPEKEEAKKGNQAQSLLLQVSRTELFPCGDSLNGRAP